MLNLLERCLPFDHAVMEAVQKLAEIGGGVMDKIMLALTFLGQFDKDPADRFKVLLGMEDGNVLGEAAMASAVPEDFVVALVSRTLSEMKFF